MIVYNTTYHVEKEVQDECLEFLKQQYIPQAMSSGFLLKPCLRRVMFTEPEDGISFAIQFHVKNVDTLNYWLESEGKAIQQVLVNRFGQKIAGFSTLLEELDWEV